MSRFGVRTLLISTQFPAKLFNTRLISSKTRYRAFWYFLGDLISPSVNLTYYTGEQWGLVLRASFISKEVVHILDYGSFSIQVDKNRISIKIKTMVITYMYNIELLRFTSIPKNLHTKVIEIMESTSCKLNDFEYLLDNLWFLTEIDCKSKKTHKYYKNQLHLIKGDGEVKTFDIDDVPDIID